MSAPMTIYRAAGEPPVEVEAEGVCRLCGAADRGLRFGRWVKPTFTDHDILGPGDITCRGCLLLTQNNSAFYQRILGRDKPQKPWNWSHIVSAGRYVVLSKASKSAMVDLLLSEPEVAVIAVSGQKHLAFRATPGIWQFELTAIRPAPAELSALLELTTALYTAGATKAEIGSGHYDARTIRRVGLSDWRGWELELRPHRGGALFELAVFLTQKQEIDDDHESDRPAPIAASGQLALL